MTSPNIAHPDLLREFTGWVMQNRAGGWATRWRRRPVWLSQVIQKLGLEREVSAPLFWGERMQVITTETVSRGLLTFGYGEPTITALMLILLREGQTMVDVGTHFAYEALLGCRLVGESGSVIGFEPNLPVFELASRNRRAHPQAHLRQKAVADHDGVTRFQRRPVAQSAFGGIDDRDVSETFEVIVTQMDTELAGRSQPIDFIKCDAEGYEMAVLRGATEILAKDRPVLVLEADMPTPDGLVSPRAHEMDAYLSERGYKAYNFDFIDRFRFGKLNAFPVQHANIVFLPTERTDVLATLLAAGAATA